MTVLATRFAVLTVILATPALASSSADRSFDPSDYTPGQAVTVTITLSVDAGVMAMALEDAPPSGWTVSNISNGGVWDSTNELVRWGMFFQGGMPTTLTYEATPPGGESGTKTFAGTMYLDGSSQAVTGESSIDSDNSLTDGLVAYYPFDGDPNDYSGSGNHGTAHGDVSYLSGVHGQGATFDGNSDFVTLAQPLPSPRSWRPSVAWVANRKRCPIIIRATTSSRRSPAPAAECCSSR